MSFLEFGIFFCMESFLMELSSWFRSIWHSNNVSYNINNSSYIQNPQKKAPAKVWSIESEGNERLGWIFDSKNGLLPRITSETSFDIIADIPSRISSEKNWDFFRISLLIAQCFFLENLAWIVPKISAGILQKIRNSSKRFSEILSKTFSKILSKILFVWIV